MTLEEKAKKLASSVPLRKDIPFQDYIRIQLASMYYTGAIENGVVWHDLRKNPQDLPPCKGFETYSERLITDKGYSVYNFRKCRWYVDEPDCDCMVHRDVIAWCEIPKFKGE